MTKKIGTKIKGPVMTLMQSWMDSLQLLKPKNLKLFALVTLKSIIDTYKLMFRFFWWIIPVFIVFFLLLSLIGPYTIPNYYGPLEAIRDRNMVWFHSNLKHIIDLIWLIILLAVCFITRPSVEQKNWHYLLKQYKKIIIYIAIVWPIFFKLLNFFYVEISLLTGINFYQPLFYHWYHIFFITWYILTILFFTDSDGGFKNSLRALWNSLKMIIFNFPLLMILSFLWVPFLFNSLYYLLHGAMPTKYYVLTYYYYTIYTLLNIIVFPIVVCPIANIYIKKVHDQFDLYFKRQTPQE